MSSFDLLSFSGAARRAARRRRRWSAANPGNQAARKELLDAIRAIAGERLGGRGPILDVGCGTGWLLEALAEDGVEPDRLYGLDLDPNRIRAARGRVPGAHVDVGDGRRLPHTNGKFAVVSFIVSLSSIGSGTDARRALREGMRVLAPGGVLLCYEPRVPTPVNRSTRLLRRSDLRACGMDWRDSTTLTVLPPLGRRLGARARSLYPRLARIPPLRTHRLYVYRV